MKTIKVISCICILLSFMSCAHQQAVQICQNHKCTALTEANSEDAVFLKLTDMIKANLGKEVPLMISSSQGGPVNKGLDLNWATYGGLPRFLQMHSLTFTDILFLDRAAREAKVMAHVNISSVYESRTYAVQAPCILSVKSTNKITLKGSAKTAGYDVIYFDVLINSIDIDRESWSSAFEVNLSPLQGSKFHNPRKECYLHLSFKNAVIAKSEAFAVTQNQSEISKPGLSYNIPVEDKMAKTQTITQTVKQPFGGSQSADDARIAAIAKAKREALEKAGVYIEKLTVVKNSQVEKNEILALTANVLKTEVVSQKNYASDESFGIEVVVKVIVDDAMLEEKVKKQLQDKEHLGKIKDAQMRENEFLQKIEQLEEQNRTIAVNTQGSEKLKKEFQKASQVLKAMDWFNKAGSLWDGRTYTDAGKAIKYLNAAIELQPDYANAYSSRGFAYSELGQYQSAIKDYSEAIKRKPDDVYYFTNRAVVYNNLGMYQLAIDDSNKALSLKPDYALLYNNRGIAYSELGQHQRAILDYNEAIRLEPDYANAYNNRGDTYNELGQYQRAIEDFNKAILLKPDYANAYNNRAVSYNKLGQYQSAIKDYSEAIRLKPYDVHYVTNRSVVYNNIGMYQAAISDCNEAIRENPDYAMAYRSRGSAFFSRGDCKLGCSDARRACELGDCDLWESNSRKGICH